MIKVSFILIASVLIFPGCDNTPTDVEQENQGLESKISEIGEKNGQLIDGQYIVVFKSNKNKDLGKAKTAEIAAHTIKSTIRDYRITSESVISEYKYSISGFAAKLDERQLESLKHDDRVAYVEQDRVVALSAPGTDAFLDCYLFDICKKSGGAQETPYGVTLVGGPIDGTGLTAWIIDTGIDFFHDDLNVDTRRSISFVPTERGAKDRNGHGTHVAGIIAAIDNDIDVVGVAAGATVVSVKVLNSQGVGTISNVIEGIDYVAEKASPGDAANLSLTAGASKALDKAVLRAARQGIYFALAAGNESADTNNSSPARVNGTNIWTVSAIDKKGNLAWFSNFGNPPIDFAAPGVNVESLWKSKRLNTASGTSMAAPHVAGILLITHGNPKSKGKAKGDFDGIPDLIVHR